MFGQLGQLATLLRHLPRLKEETEKFAAKMTEIVAEGTAGGGMVTARVNGKMEVLKVTVTDEAYALGDRGMLEDLIAAAMNQAITKAREAVAVEAKAMAEGMGLPTNGMGIPGLM